MFPSVACSSYFGYFVQFSRCVLVPKTRSKHSLSQQMLESIFRKNGGAKIIKGYAPLYQLSAIIALSFLLDSMEAHLFRGYVCQRLKQPASMITPIFLLGNTNN